jgi:hypothetical protein
MLLSRKAHHLYTRIPPSDTNPNILSFWEEAKVNRQIHTLVKVGKMKPSVFKYTCKMTLPSKKDESK